MESDKDITISGLQNTVNQWITTVGVRYFSPLTNMAILSEEVGEVARIMARKHGDQSFKPGEISPEDALTEPLLNNLAKKNIRDKERHLNNPKLKQP